MTSEPIRRRRRLLRVLSSAGYSPLASVAESLIGLKYLLTIPTIGKAYVLAFDLSPKLDLAIENISGSRPLRR
jgi:hypothetical protein